MAGTRASTARRTIVQGRRRHSRRGVIRGAVTLGRWLPSRRVRARCEAAVCGEGGPPRGVNGIVAATVVRGAEGEMACRMQLDQIDDDGIDAAVIVDGALLRHSICQAALVRHSICQAALVGRRPAARMCSCRRPLRWIRRWWLRWPQLAPSHECAAVGLATTRRCEGRVWAWVRGGGWGCG